MAKVETSKFTGNTSSPAFLAYTHLAFSLPGEHSSLLSLTEFCLLGSLFSPACGCLVLSCHHVPERNIPRSFGLPLALWVQDSPWVQGQHQTGACFSCLLPGLLSFTLLRTVSVKVITENCWGWLEIDPTRPASLFLPILLHTPVFPAANSCSLLSFMF